MSFSAIGGAGSIAIGPGRLPRPARTATASRGLLPASILVLALLGSCQAPQDNSLRRARLEAAAAHATRAEREQARVDVEPDLLRYELKDDVRRLPGEIEELRVRRRELVADLDEALRTVRVLEQDLAAAKKQQAGVKAQLEAERRALDEARKALESLRMEQNRIDKARLDVQRVLDALPPESRSLAEFLERVFATPIPVEPASEAAQEPTERKGDRDAKSAETSADGEKDG